MSPKRARDRTSTLSISLPRELAQAVSERVRSGLCASRGIEPEIVAEATLLEIEPGVRIPGARTRHLIATKVLSVREERDQDAADLSALLALASRADLRGARSALGHIAARGFDRGRDLTEEFDRFRDAAR